jgi:hypothetical protein
MKREEAGAIECFISGEKSAYLYQPDCYFVDRWMGDFCLRLFDDGWTIMDREGRVMSSSKFHALTKSVAKLADDLGITYSAAKIVYERGYKDRECDNIVYDSEGRAIVLGTRSE